MKKILTLGLFLFTSFLYSQNTNNLLKFEDLENHLYKTDYINAGIEDEVELKIKFKEIILKLLADSNKTTIKELNNYTFVKFILITKSEPETSWNVSIIANFKNSKITLKIYDLGNTYIPPGAESTTWNQSAFFITNNQRIPKEGRNIALNEWMENINGLIENLKNELKKPI